MRVWGAILCALWCVIALGVIALRAPKPGAFDTDIQSLLPQNALEPVIRAAIADASSAAGARVTMLVGGEDAERVQNAAVELERDVVATGVYAPAREDGEAMGRYLFANRNALICETNPSHFDAQRVLDNSMALLYAPLTPISGEMLARDPFLLTLQLGQCLTPAATAPADGSVLVSGTLNASAFRIDVQDKIGAALDAWRARWPNVAVSRAGAVFFAEDGARTARAEISLIASASTIAILLLLLACFRRPHALIGTLIATAAGAAGSLAATLLLFPSVHVLVFVFGSALIGVTSDYALHYLATGPQTRWADRAERIRRVARPIAVCASATALGFASLGLFGVPIFNQVAVFSVAGILTAWWFTLTLLPLMDPRARNVEKLAAWWERIEAPFLAVRIGKPHIIVASVAVLGVAILGVARFGVLDDVRQFQQRSPVLSAEEERVRDAVGFSASPVFLLSYGASADEARAREEAALAQWPDEAARDVIAASRFDPSAARRTENETLLHERLYEPHLAERVATLGLTDAQPYAPSDSAPLPGVVASLSGVAGSAHYLVAALGATAAASARATGGGSLLVDPAARYTRAFADFRVRAAWAVAATFGVCALIVLALYRKWRALSVLGAPIFGVAMAVAVPSALGAPLSFFSVAALFVVIGAGIDHSVFLFESAESGGEAKELVVFLAALTTILSMGLLAFSSVYPVRSFGLAVTSGVTAAYLFSFFMSAFDGSGRRARG